MYGLIGILFHGSSNLAAEEKIFLCVGYKKVSFFIKGKQFLS